MYLFPHAHRPLQILFTLCVILTIYIKFKRVGDSLELRVMDDGIGFPVDKLQESKSLGLKLVNILVGQLRGKISVKGHDGSCFRIVFKG